MNINATHRFYSASDFYKETFGQKVYKISLDAGCTCPTRDGTKGTRGCIFCSARGSGDFAASRTKSIEEQAQDAKKLVDAKLQGRNKANQKKAYIAYFQNFTNTYGNAEILKQKYFQALNVPDVQGLTIATRPDCISDDILKIITEISKTHFVSIELGFQTSNEKTATYIRRSYTNAEYTDAISRIKTAAPNIHIVTHVLFGLPNETKLDMMNTVNYCINARTDGIKFTVLYVLNNTDLQTDYERKKFNTMTMQEYFEILSSAINSLPQDIVIHRLTGDAPKSLLIAPLWTANKKNVMNSMTKYFNENNILQGKTHLPNND